MRRKGGRGVGREGRGGGGGRGEGGGRGAHAACCFSRAPLATRRVRPKERERRSPLRLPAAWRPPLRPPKGARAEGANYPSATGRRWQ